MIKKILTALGVGVIVVLAIFFYIGNKGSNEAGSYNDKIIDMDQQILDAFEDLDNKFDDSASVDLEKERLNIVTLVEKNTDTLKTMIPPKLGDEGFREAELQMFILYKKWAEQDYKELVGIYSQKDPSDASLSRADKIYDQIEKEEKPLLDKVDRAQKAFAKKYVFEIE